MTTSQSLTFQDTPFDVVCRSGQPWLRSGDIARALGYAREDSVARIYERNKDEFTENMTLTVNLTVKGFGNGESEKEVRIFSLRGTHLIAMFARTPVAKAFRRWVLDVLDQVSHDLAEAAPADSARMFTATREAIVKRLGFVHDVLAGQYRSEFWSLLEEEVCCEFSVASLDEMTEGQGKRALEWVSRIGTNELSRRVEARLESKRTQLARQGDCLPATPTQSERLANLPEGRYLVVVGRDGKLIGAQNIESCNVVDANVVELVCRDSQAAADLLNEMARRLRVLDGAESVRRLDQPLIPQL
ncbi:BRO family protein [Chromobacterium sp. S0633]|uniref:BRO-N domain-containing protein n=1 Tax=Chromobacterium sp. S0633 TaxID=2957805 RepID=UPI00209F978F|nr:BRO family protein [Chromobacterium sp. S0633]MCP1290897.1 BRO family protein [Chromobacterium sp. S0633]